MTKITCTFDNYLYMKRGFPVAQSACNEGNLDLVPGLGRFPGEGKGYPLQYSGLENSIDYIAHGVANSRPQLSDFHFPSKHKKKKFIGNGSLNEIRCIQEWILPSAIMIRVQHQFLWWLSGKESACNTGDVGSIPGSGRSPGEGNGNPLQYSGLENPTDREAWWLQFRDLKRVRTQLND